MSDEPQTTPGETGSEGEQEERKPRARAGAKAGPPDAPRGGANDGQSNDPPAAAPEPDVEKYDVAGWKERSRWFSKDFPKANAHAVAGALYDAQPGDVFSREEVAARLGAFYEHEVEV